MTQSFQDHAELGDLLHALCEETITPEQMRRLEELVLAHPEAEALYVQCLDLQAGLARHFAASPATIEPSLRRRIETPSPPARFRRLRGVPLKVMGLAGLAAGVIVAIALTWEKAVTVPSPGEPGAEPTDDSVAILVEAAGAEWGDTGMPTRTGAPLPAGRLLLKAGCAKVEFYSGATVILEGPADFKLISPRQAYCARGKLRVMVPPQAQGFAIGSRRIDLVDRGTEFGMHVESGDRTEVHVFQGKVDLYDPGAGQAGAPRQVLTTGHGVRLGNGGASSPIAANSDAFVTAHDLALRTEAETRRRQRDWLAARDALRRDPGLLVYYSFETEKTWQRTLQDRTQRADRPHDGAIVGCQWVTGRWPGKQGLEFKRVSDRVRLHVPGEHASLTLVAWVRVDALPNRFNSLLMADGWDEGSVHWHINDAGMIALGIQGPNRKQGVDYRTPRVFAPERFGQWTQLAVVFDRAAQQVTHYVDGRQVSQHPVRSEVPLHIRDAELGNWNIADYRDSRPIRNFNGCMDEFLLYTRALDAQEVQELRERGRPRP
jgi:hypothetical protein